MVLVKGSKSYIVTAMFGIENFSLPFCNGNRGPENLKLFAFGRQVTFHYSAFYFLKYTLSGADT